MNYGRVIKSNYSALMVTYGSMIFEGAIITLLIALMSPLSIRYGVSTSTISTLLAARAVGNVSSVYFSGNASDKIGKKKMILFGLIFYFVFLIGMMITSNFYVALFLSLIAGIGHGFMDSPSMSMLIDIFGDHSGPAMSVVAVFFSGGGVMSSFIVGRLLANSLDFRIIFIVYLVIASIVAIIAYSATYPKRQVREIKKTDDSSEKDKKILLKTAIFLALISFTFAAATAILMTWISTYTFEVQGLSIENSLAMLSFLQLGSVIGAVVFAVILTRVHSTKIIIANGFLAVISLVIFLNLSNNGVILIMIAGAVLSIVFSLSLNVVGELFIENSGQATGFIATASMSATMIVTFITGKLLPVIGVESIMWIGVWLAVVATVFAIIFRGVFIKVRTTVIDQK